MTEILLILAAIPLAAFMYRYSRYSPWKSTLQGRALMVQKGATLALVLFILARHVLPDAPWVPIVRGALVTILIVMFWVMLFGLMKAQNARLPSFRLRGYRRDKPTDKKE